MTRKTFNWRPCLTSLALCAASVAAQADMTQSTPTVAPSPPMSNIANPPAAATLSADRHRPRFHFSPPIGWMNDPNGLVYADGIYHLFYQYYPLGDVWGPMHWGHATSRDLLRWEHLPIALAPDGPDGQRYIFSGSAVHDTGNTAGFGAGALVALYTSHDMAAEKAGRTDIESQHLAWSTDGGRHWTKFDGNPVLPNAAKRKDFRDPKVVRDTARDRWLMALAVGEHTALYASTDLRRWEHLSDVGAGLGSHAGVWECPDFFEMPVIGGRPGERKWVLLQSLTVSGPNGGSATQYFVGDFDGRDFIPDPAFARDVRDGKAIWLDHGRDNYAGVSWSGTPGDRRIMIGWMSNWDYALKVPTTGWRSAMTLPTELQLRVTPQGYRLFSQPVAETASLRQRSVDLPAGDVATTLDLVGKTGISPAAAELELEFDLPGNATPGHIWVELSNARGERYRIGYDSARRQFVSDRTAAGAHDFSDKFARAPHTAPRPAGGPLRLHLFFDVSSAELFADDGAVRMTELFYPGEVFTQARLVVEGGPVRLTRGRMHALARPATTDSSKTK